MAEFIEDTSETTQVFLDWIIANGGTIIDEIRIGILDDGSKGIFAINDISNSYLCYIPKKLYLTAENDPRLEHITDTKIALCGKLLLEMRSSDSFWKPYLDMLPARETFNTHPLVVYETDRDIWSHICPQIYSHFTSIKNNINTALQELSKVDGLSSINIDDVTYAILLVMTRAWSVLVPFMDLFNHDSVNGLMPRYTDDGILYFNTNKIGKGQQVFFLYNIYSNHILFVNYGFIESSLTTKICICASNTSQRLWISKFGMSPQLYSLLNSRANTIKFIKFINNTVLQVAVYQKCIYEDIIRMDHIHDTTKMLCQALIDLIDICKTAIGIINSNELILQYSDDNDNNSGIDTLGDLSFV